MQNEEKTEKVEDRLIEYG